MTTIPAPARYSDLYGLLAMAATRNPTAIAVSDAHQSITCADLLRRALRAASRMRDHGVRPGDRVVLRLDGGVDFTVLLYGVLRMGGVAVPVSPGMPDFHLRWVLRDAEPALVVDPETFDSRPSHDGHLDAFPWPGPRPDDVALLMYTSGSTAMPRAVVCPHDRVLFVVAAIAERLRYRADDVVFCGLPVSFDYGLYQIFLSTLSGARLVLRPDVSDPGLLTELRESGATVLPVVPTLATMLARLAKRDSRTTSVRMVTNTGAALTPAHATALRQAFPGASIVPMYGMTECKRVTVADPDEDLVVPGTVGRPLEGTTVHVVGPDGRSLPTGAVGQIVVRGPHVMAGYWGDIEASTERFPAPAELWTGDHGYLDTNGRLFLIGRADDIFKRKGIRTSVPEIEAALVDVPGVESAAVLRPEPGGELVAWVTGAVEPTAVLAGVAERLDLAKVPDRCVVTTSLPTTVNGKIDRHALAGRGVR